MASYRKRNNVWNVEVFCKGQRASNTFNTKAEANAWATQKEVELRTTDSSSLSLAEKNKTFYDYVVSLKKLLPPLLTEGLLSLLRYLKLRGVSGNGFQLIS